jgi:hypothetical protein
MSGGAYLFGLSGGSSSLCFVPQTTTIICFHNSTNRDLSLLSLSSSYVHVRQRGLLNLSAIAVVNNLRSHVR